MLILIQILPVIKCLIGSEAVLILILSMCHQIFLEVLCSLYFVNMRILLGWNLVRIIHLNSELRSGSHVLLPSYSRKRKAQTPLYRVYPMDSIIYPRQRNSAGEVTEAILRFPKTENPNHVRLQYAIWAVPRRFPIPPAHGPASAFMVRHLQLVCNE